MTDSYTFLPKLTPARVADGTPDGSSPVPVRRNSPGRGVVACAAAGEPIAEMSASPAALSAGPASGVPHAARPDPIPNDAEYVEAMEMYALVPGERLMESLRQAARRSRERNSWADRVRAAHAAHVNGLTDADLRFDEKVHAAELAAARGRLNSGLIAEVKRVMRNTAVPVVPQPSGDDDDWPMWCAP